MGNSGSHLKEQVNAGLHLGGHDHHGLKYMSKEDPAKAKDPGSKPIYVVGTVSTSRRAKRSPFGEEVGVAIQVSVFKNDGYPALDALEYLFTGTEAVEFEIEGYSIDNGQVSGNLKTYRFDADMSKITFKLRQTHVEQYILFDKKQRVLRSHPTDREWGSLYPRPNANKFWDRHAHNSRKGEMAMLRSMLNAPIPIPRLAKERVLKIGDPVGVWALPVENADGSVTLKTTEDGRLVVTNSDGVIKSLNYRRPPGVEDMIRKHDPRIIPMGEIEGSHMKTSLDGYDDGV